jgi:hypothetical protein
MFQIASYIYDEAFKAIDMEPEYDGDAAGYIAIMVEAAFVKAVKFIDNGDGDDVS